ncbi:single-stranded DNA-binding protein [Enterococcus ureasiticus]|uniref:single-stranded DNA-binding protein n=1 Tax=Enterococcus ureasiticus TaxID=903984 RepID=UPI001A904C39|nr:single-stranded DNA-binding protein [Enterococcus ureasiticus]MBO0474864.1 single-stranded DNA-binding protein [Enterococcus ureasiticus]
MRNDSILIGRLSKDPACKKTNSGTRYLQFTLIVERDFKKNGKKEVDTIPCIAWRKTAELMEQYLKKGSLIDVSGRIQTRSYSQNGQRKFVVEVIAERFHILESKAVTDQRAAKRNGGETDQADLYYQENGSYDPFGFGEEPIEISDEDIPF